MQLFRASLSFVLAFLASLLLAHAQENPPIQEPQLRIEAGMHTAQIFRIGVSADGRLLVTGSGDKTVRLWSLPDGGLIKTFRVPVGPVNDGQIYAVAISPDGRLIAAGGSDAYWSRNAGQTDGYFIYLFDTISGALVRRLGPLPDVINELAFSPDGKYLVAGLGKDGIRVWPSPFTGNPVSDTQSKDSVYGIAFDSAGSGRFATTSDDGMIRVYEGATTDLIPKVVNAASGDHPFGIAFSPDGKTLAVGYDDTTKIDLISVPDLVRVHEVNTSLATNGNLGSVAFSKDGRSLYAGGLYNDSDDFQIFRWPNAGRGAPVKLGGPSNTILDLVPLPGGGIVYGSGDPGFGIYGADDKPVLIKTPVQTDMRGKRSGHFAESADATGVWFGLKWGADDPQRFDVNSLSFTAAPWKPWGYVEPVTDTLVIQGWQDEEQPTLDNQVLALKQFEVSRSLAIAPDAKSFVLGTDWHIYRFDARARKIPPYPISTESAAWGVNLSADGSIITAALHDGTIRWYRTEDGAPLLALFVHVPDKRWIAWTPKGYYAASPGGEDLIGWQVNGKSWDDPVSFFPAAQFHNRFYRPDIVQLVLKTKDEARAIEQANIIAKRKSEEIGVDKDLPPVVEIIANPRGIEANTSDLALKYRLRSPSGQAVTRLELRIDGQLTQPRAIEIFDESLTLDTELIMRVPLPPRDVTVSLTAFIDERASEAAQVPVRWTGRSQEGPKPKLYALLIGVSEYDEPKLRLSYAAKDAMDVDAALKRQKGKFFADVETVILTDENATETRIRIELSKLRDKVAGADNNYAFVFMAGHGITPPEGGFYFLPANASLAPNELEATSLDGVVIRKNLSTMKAKVLFFMDACNAGNGIDGNQALADMTGFANELALSNGVVMYASSTGRQFSYENSEWKNGAFTHALVSVFDDAEAYGRDGLLSISELDEQLTARVEALTNGLQTPVMTKSAAIPRFFIASVQ